MGRLTVNRNHHTHRWEVRKGGDMIHDWPEFCWPIAYAHARYVATLDGLSIEEIR